MRRLRHRTPVGCGFASAAWSAWDRLLLSSHLGMSVVGRHSEMAEVRSTPHALRRSDALLVRVRTAAIGLPLLIGLLWAVPAGVSALLALVAAVGMWELVVLVEHTAADAVSGVTR